MAGTSYKVTVRAATTRDIASKTRKMDVVFPVSGEEQAN